mmetsp:Transcript_4039/g.7349  ORF Transcript_4039/g.7349 Transcript_4039/m.7349 type:complete len:450 (-) Transcript_4039:162-1511(-)
MESLLQFLGCATVEKAVAADKDASDMQLSAFEFRHYRTSLEKGQQKLVERVVNQWVAMLVKGVIMRVNGFEEKTFLDKDLLNLEVNGELYPLDALCRMEMHKESDDVVMNVPWILDLTFDFEEGETVLSFSFEQERFRLQFALMLRILRTRNPHLNLTGSFEVLNRDEVDEDNMASNAFNKIVSTNRYDVQGAGITIAISVGLLKIHQLLRCNNRHVYLEMFSDYPRRDKFLYAKSSYNNLPGAVLLGDDTKIKKDDEKNTQEDSKKNKGDQVLCTINFDLKNVKLKIPKVPFNIHGRLMVKDDFFPTVVGIFELNVTKAHVQDIRESAGTSQPRTPEAVELPLLRSWKGDENTPEEIATLSVRFLGFVTEENERKQNFTGSKRSKASNEASSSEGGGEEEEEEEEEDDEADDEEDEDNGNDESEDMNDQGSQPNDSSASQLTSSAASS